MTEVKRVKMIKVDGRLTRLRRFRVRLLVLSEVPAQYASVTVELLAANYLDAQERVAALFKSELVDEDRGLEVTEVERTKYA